MRVEIEKTEHGLLLTPKRYNRGGRYVGTAVLTDVVIKDGIITGDLLGEYLEVYPFTKANLPRPVTSQMKPVTTAVTSARVLYVAGEEMFYLAR